MVKPKAINCPNICYRPIKPSDREVLEQIHGNLFPIRYESDFFNNVVNGRDIVSWAAVDHNRPDGRSDELIGFVTARTVLAKDTEDKWDVTGDMKKTIWEFHEREVSISSIAFQNETFVCLIPKKKGPIGLRISDPDECLSMISDLLLHDSLSTDQTLVYILTLGVVETYRNLGIASSLVQKVIKYASSMPTCRAVYLHVISYNSSAIKFYKKMSFKCLQKLPGFYFINGQHYDSYLFVYYVNGGRSPCSLLEVVSFMVTCLRDGIKFVTSRLRKNEKRKVSKWPKCKESRSLISMAQSKRNLAVESSSGYECV